MHTTGSSTNKNIGLLNRRQQKDYWFNSKQHNGDASWTMQQQEKLNIPQSLTRYPQVTSQKLSEI